MDSKEPKKVLVTGGGGYLGLHVIHQFVKEGHKVRTTVRNLNDQTKIDSIKNAAKDSKNPIEFFEADLLKAETWAGPVKDCDIVCHVASPFPSVQPKDENDLLKPAVEGTLNVLNAAFNANVRRVIVTSSTAAVNTVGLKNKTFTENDWADPEKTNAYGKSKIFAEKAAWDFVEEKKKNNQKCFELAVINPCFILGPTLHKGDFAMGTSESRIFDMLTSKLEKLPPFYFGHCDVRDVAKAHMLAAFTPEAAGHRHIIISTDKYISHKVAAEILQEEFGPQGYKISSELEPNEDPNNNADNSRMVKVLGITPTDYKKTIIDMAYSLIAAKNLPLPKNT